MAHKIPTCLLCCLCFLFGGVDLSALVFPQTGTTYDPNQGLVDFPSWLQVGYLSPLSTGQTFYPCLTPIAPQWFMGAKHTIVLSALDVSGPGSMKIRYKNLDYNVTRIVGADDSDIVLLQISGSVPDYVPLYKKQILAGAPLTVYGRGSIGTTPIKTPGNVVLGWETANLDGRLRQGVGVAQDSSASSPVIRWDFTPTSCWADVIDSGGPVFVGPALAGCLWSHTFADGYATECGGTPQFEKSLFNPGQAISWIVDRNQKVVCFPFAGHSSASIASSVYFDIDWIYNLISAPLLVNAGGATPGWTPWVANPQVTLLPIDVVGILDPAPQSVYQTVNSLLAQPSGVIEYRADNLLGTESYRVRLHFSNFWQPGGSLNEDIYINGSLVRANFDPAASTPLKASVLEFSGVTPVANAVTIGIKPHNVLGNAAICGIEILRDNNPELDNLILPSNGGTLESFTSQLNNSWAAANLTDGVKQGTGNSWSSTNRPAVPQEFVYSFRNHQIASLDSIAVYNYGEAASVNASREMEVYQSIDGLSWGLINTATLAQQEGAQFVDLGGSPARYVKIRIKSGYSTNFWELGEIEVHGVLQGNNLLLPGNGGTLVSFTSQLDGNTWAAAKLSDGIRSGTGFSWASALSPSSPQEFVYSFQNQQLAFLNWMVIYNYGEAAGTYYSKEIEFYSSLDGVAWTLAGNGTLQASGQAQVFKLNGTSARYLKAAVKSGYSQAHWDLGEIEAYGTLAIPNTPPTANPADFTTLEDVSIAVNLTGSDPESSSLLYTLVTQPKKGSLLGMPPYLIYVPNRNANGVDSFTFKVNDGASDSSPAAVTINLTPVNDPPTLKVIPNQALAVNSGLFSIDLAGIGTGASNELQTLTITATSDNAELISNPVIAYNSADDSATLSFTPNPDALGRAIVSVVVKDDGGTANGGRDSITNQFQVVVSGSIPVSDPVVSATMIQNGKKVRLTATTVPADSQIRYTQDGSEPAWSSGALYNELTPPEISAATTLKFKAFKSGYISSGTVTTQVQKLAAPTVTQSGAIVTITAPLGAQVKYARRYPNLLHPENWIVGTGIQQDFLANGDPGENEVELGQTPYGTNDKIWVASNLDVVRNADGGWDTSGFGIDNTRTYRYSVWLKKNGSDGSFYFGTAGVTQLDGTPDENPYFWSGNDLAVDEWHLVVGYIHPSDYTGASASKVYDSSGVPTSIGNDFKWPISAVNSQFRAYLYYAADLNLQQRFWNPRVEIVDSTSGPEDVYWADAVDTVVFVNLTNTGGVWIEAVSSSSDPLLLASAPATFQSTPLVQATGIPPSSVETPPATTPAGAVWTARESNRFWSSVASSGDGAKLITGAQNGQIYTSTDSGMTWRARESNRVWSSVASSSDGSNLVAVVQSGQIYTSTDAGATWTARETNRNWESVASSSDGSNLVAVVQNGQIYTSTDSGATWTPRETNRNWESVASSSDGSKLVAVVYGGQIYTSTDSGVNWTARESTRDWRSVVSSTDGGKLVAVVYNGQIYTSADSGFSWIAQNSGSNQWLAAASSTDGSKLVAVVYSGQIYTSVRNAQTQAPVITWNNPADTIYGTALGPSQLNASSDVPAGIFSYNPPSGAILHAGNNQTLTVTFTPNDTSTYSVATMTVAINVNKAPLTITADDQAKLYGDAVPPLTVHYTGFVGSDSAASLLSLPVASTSATASSPIGSYPITVAGAASPDYKFSLVAGTLIITTTTPQDVTQPIAPVITWNNPTNITFGTALGATQLNASSDVPAGSFSYNPPLGTLLRAGNNQNLIATFTPTDTGTYSIARLTVVINVNKAPLTITADDQTILYGDAIPSLTLHYAGFVGSDSAAALSSPPVAGTSATAGSGVGNYPITVTGAAAADYFITPAAGTLGITALPLTVTSVAAASKMYDGTTTAVLNVSGASLNGVRAADVGNVTLSGTATGIFADKNVGTGKSVTLSGLTLSGASSANYILTQPSATANITPLSVAVTGITAADKVYDGLTAATVDSSGASLNGVLPSDGANVTLTGTATGLFVDKNFGSGKSVTVSGLGLAGSASGNYTLMPPTTAANISALGLTVTGVTAANKVYDGTTAAMVNTGSAVLSGILANDSGNVTLGGTGLGTFADKNVGTGKAVTISGLTLSGASSANYTLTQPSTTANISPLGVAVTGATAADKVYDGMTAATVDSSGASLNGVLASDSGNVTLTGRATGLFADKNVGSGKTVTVSGFGLAGSASGNYTLTQPTTAANISALGLTVTGVMAANKVYDATTVADVNSGSALLSGVLAADAGNISLGGTATGAFQDKNVETGKRVTVTGLVVSGSSSGNYTLTQPSTTANITPLGVAVTGVTAADKVYDGTTVAAISANAAALVGVVSGDTLTLVSSGAMGAFTDMNVGTAKTVVISGLTFSGASSANYTLMQPTTTADITPLSLSFSGVAFDGYISNGIAFFDANRNGVLDPGEPQTPTDGTGHFTTLVVSVDLYDLNKNGQIDPAEGRIVVVGGTDIATGFPLESPLTAPFGYQNVSPLTTLISALIDQNSNTTTTNAAAQVMAAFGLPAEASLANYDPFQATNDSNAALLVKAAAQVHSLTKEISSLLSGALTNKNQISESVIQVLAAEIQAHPNAVIHLEETNVIQRLIFQAQSANQLDTNSPMNISNVTGAATIIAQANLAMNNIVGTNGNLTEVVRVQVAAEGKVSIDLESVGKGTLSVAEAVTDNTGAALVATIQGATVGNIDGNIAIRMTLSRVGSEIHLEWPNGPMQLQAADSITGPWQLISTNQTSPYITAPATQAKYFRLQK